jgi:putative Mn2+ efflux pump MntP
MDAFAVSICKGLSVRKVSGKHVLSTALWFGGFQALMPLVGYFMGVSFADFVSSVDHWIAFVLLGIIGGKMVKESLEKDESCELNPDFSFRTMLVMAIATSIDALAVGVSFAFLRVNIWTAVLLIGTVTAAFSGAGVEIGNIFGCRYKSKAEFAGGFILILMGLKILFEHTLL